MISPAKDISKIVLLIFTHFSVMVLKNQAKSLVLFHLISRIELMIHFIRMTRMVRNCS